MPAARGGGQQNAARPLVSTAWSEAYLARESYRLATNVVWLIEAKAHWKGGFT